VRGGPGKGERREEGRERRGREGRGGKGKRTSPNSKYATTPLSSYDWSCYLLPPTNTTW